MQATDPILGNVLDSNRYANVTSFNGINALNYTISNDGTSIILRLDCNFD